MDEVEDAATKHVFRLEAECFGVACADVDVAFIYDLGHNKGVNLILSSHLLPDVEFACDHIIVMDKGHVATAGPIAALKQPQGQVFEVRVKMPSAPIDVFVSRLRAEGFEPHATDEDVMRVFVPGEDRNRDDNEILQGIQNPAYAERFGAQYEHARHDIELVREAAPVFDEAEFLAGHQTPMFFGSAINNFGVREVLDALVDLAPPPGPKPAMQRLVQPDEPKFSGVVFKIQANMDPAHRDRIAFVRVASGHFTRGMKLKVTRSGKELKPNTVVSFLSQRRELLDEAYAGDIIGIPNHGVLQLGDTLTEGEALQFTGLPFFAPEMFRSVEVADPLKTKQLKAGLTQLGEEGAIQVFRPVAGTVLLLGAVGQLQFEVVAHRLEHEYGCKARIQPARYSIARWVTCDAADGGDKELQRFIDGNAHRMALDAVAAPTILVEYAPELRAIESNWPKIKFHALREHAGLVFQKKLEG